LSRQANRRLIGAFCRWVVAAQVFDSSKAVLRVRFAGDVANLTR
jgi:hypothetical protein